MTAGDSSVERPVPYNIEAEEAVIGACLMDTRAFNKVVSIVSADDFYRERHAVIWSAINALSDAGMETDLLTVTDRLEDMRLLSKVGGPAALNDLIIRVPTALHVEHYARIVATKALQRRLIYGAEGLAQLPYQQMDPDPEALRAKADSIYFGLWDGTYSGPDISLLEDAFGEAYTSYEKVAIGEMPGLLTTGFVDLDRLLNGLEKGSLWVLIARPGMGKSAFALDVAINVTCMEKRVLFCSLEMERKALVDRIISKRTGIPMPRLRAGHLSESDLNAIAAAMDAMKGWQLVPTYVPGMSTKQLRHILARTPYSYDLVVVDYLQKMSGSDAFGRTERVAAIASDLKTIAGEFGTRIFAPAQAARDVDNRNNKVPQMHDCQWSSNIEQDADIVCSLYRDEFYHANTDRPGLAEVIVLKHRNGPVGEVDLRFKRETAIFQTLSFMEDNDAPDHIDDMIF